MSDDASATAAPARLGLLHEGGFTLRHFEYDQHLQAHVYSLPRSARQRPLIGARAGAIELLGRVT